LVLEGNKIKHFFRREKKFSSILFLNSYISITIIAIGITEVNIYSYRYYIETNIKEI